MAASTAFGSGDAMRSDAWAQLVHLHLYYGEAAASGGPRPPCEVTVAPR